MGLGQLNSWALLVLKRFSLRAVFQESRGTSYRASWSIGFETRSLSPFLCSVSPRKSTRPARIDGGRDIDSTYKWEAECNQIVKKWIHQEGRDLWILNCSLQSFPRISVEGFAISFLPLLVSSLWHYPALASHPAIFCNNLRGPLWSWAAKQGLNKHNPLVSVCLSSSNI